MLSNGPTSAFVFLFPLEAASLFWLRVCAVRCHRRMIKEAISGHRRLEEHHDLHHRTMSLHRPASSSFPKLLCT
ncbi:hypothetical protein B0T10DRAFT_502675 [Thelonectria olida]|uniref:Uncharacterized protein n=1 Tax=Thelonectria olida TaxID=1576542 RepID=A0A9P8VQD4_9HYPO|nr:hypothetical protein B0T10DRAFT_502675 [Thelonectria olida]